MDISAVLGAQGFGGVSFGGLTDTASSLDGGVSFGDILGIKTSLSSLANQANFMQVGNDTDTGEVLTEDIAETEENVSFANLVQVLGNDISSADSDVVSAAVKLLGTVGKAVEKLFGTGSDSSFGGITDDLTDDDGDKSDIVSIFTSLLKMASADTEEEVVSEDTVSVDTILTDIADTVKAGLEEKKDARSVISEIKKAMPKVSSDDDDDDDDDDDSLEDVLMEILFTLSDIDTAAGDFDAATAEENVTEEALTALADITDTLSREISPREMAEQLVKAVKKDAASEEGDVKLVQYSEDRGAMNFASAMNAMHRLRADSSVRINDATAQLDAMKPKTETEDDENVPFGAELNPFAARFEGDTAIVGSDDEEADVTQVYKELGEITSRQITDEISESIPENGVKELTVVLKPESLGEVAVKLTSDENGVVSLVLAASDPTVGRALNENAAALSESLAKQNITVSDVNVINPAEASSYMNLDFTNQGFNRKNDGHGEESGPQYGRNGYVDEISSETGAVDNVRAQRLLKEAKLWLTA